MDLSRKRITTNERHVGVFDVLKSAVKGFQIWMVHGLASNTIVFLQRGMVRIMTCHPSLGGFVLFVARIEAQLSAFWGI